MPQNWDMGEILSLPLRRKASEDFSDARKIQRLRPGLIPRTGLPKVSMRTTRPPKPSGSTVNFTFTSTTASISGSCLGPCHRGVLQSLGSTVQNAGEVRWDEM